MAVELTGLSIQQTIKEGPVWDELRARQVPLGRSVRVLRLARGVLPSSPLANHLRRQAKALSTLDHPAVVRLLDFREKDETIVLVVEDVLSKTLADIWDPPLSTQATVVLGLGLSRALSHAHGRGLVHGRLAPDAVRFDSEGRVKLEGFGSFLPLGEVEPIETEGQAGLAPETTIGQNPSPMSDLFCLGAILYQALTGQAPFGDAKDPTFPVHVRNDTPTSLIKARPETPLALRQLIEQCLEKRAAQRPSDAAQVAAILGTMMTPSAEGALRQDLATRGVVQAGEVRMVFPGPQKQSYRPGRLEAVGLGCLMGAFVAYGAFQFQAGRQDDPSPILSLSTIKNSDNVQLRVVASPWAHVLVDGEHRETTPFAHPLALSPGRHVIRLEHPNAPAEERTVEAQAGQALLLDVRMAVKQPVKAFDASETIPEDDTP